MLRAPAAGLLSALILWAAPLAGAQAETVLLPSGAATSVISQGDWVYQVSCPAAGDCVAVGAYLDASGATQALIESEADGSWSPANVPDTSLPDAGSVPHPYLTAVNCTSVGNCVAVDAYNQANGDEEGLIDTLSAGLWTPVAAPLTGLSVSTAQSPGPGVEVYDISCPAAGGCVAVGIYVGSDTYNHGLIETQTGGGWSPIEVLGLPNSDASSAPIFEAISCATVGNCAAVGSYTDTHRDGQGLLETDSNGTWTPQEVDLSNLSPAADPQATLYSVSCPSAGNCTAVGTYEDSADSFEGLLVSEVGGVWQPATRATLPADASTLPPGTTNAPQQNDLYLNAVSCASVGNCTAVGNYDATTPNDPTANVEGVSLTETGGNWAAGLQTILPAGSAENPYVTLASVTCQAAADCVAAGTYVNGEGDNVALVARQTPGGWSTAGADLGSAYDPSPNLGSAYAASVSCATDGYCATAGYAANNASGLPNAFLLDAPAAPSALSASLSASPDGTQATVSWLPPADDGGLPLTGYTVTANDLTDAARGGQSVSVSSSAADVGLSGLTPGDTYTFTVAASSLLGAGLPTTSASVSVPSSVTPATTPTTSTTPVTSAPTSTAATTTTPASGAAAVRTTSSSTGRGPSRAQIRASLTGLVPPDARPASASRLRRTHDYALRYRALAGGRVSVGWYLVSSHARLRHQSLIASGTISVRGPGAVTIEVHLTAAGRLLLRSNPSPRLTALASYTGAAVQVSRISSFTLH